MDVGGSDDWTILPLGRVDIEGGATDAHAGRIHYRNVSRQLGQVGVLHERQDHPVHSRGAHAARPEKHDTGMEPRGMLLQVGEFETESREHAPFRVRGRPDFLVRTPEEPFVRRGCHLVAL